MKELAMAMEEQNQRTGEPLSHYVCLAPYRYQRGAGAKNGIFELMMYARKIAGESEPVLSLLSVPVPITPNLGHAMKTLELFTKVTGTMDERYIRYGGTFIPVNVLTRYHMFFIDTTNMDLEPGHEDIMWRPLKEVFFYQDPMLYVAHAEIHAALFHA